MELLTHATHPLDLSFALFAMLLALLGIAGNHKIHISSIDIGPVSNPWRLVSFALALALLAKLGHIIGSEPGGRWAHEEKNKTNLTTPVPHLHH